MSKGVDILGALDQVRGFFSEISTLLSTADAMMQKREWKPHKGSQVTSDLSYALQGAPQWMPHYVCRCYVHAGRPVLASIGVAMGVFPGDSKSEARLYEPLICGSVFLYDSDAQIDTWHLEFSTYHMWIPNRTDDGQPQIVSPQTVWPGDRCLAKELRSFALPLVDVVSADALRTRIVEPLIALTK